MADVPKPLPQTGAGRRVRVMPHGGIGGLSQPALLMLMGFAIIGALYVGRDVLIPFALAGLLSFVLAPAVRGLRRLGAPQGGAVALVVVGALLVGASLGLLMTRQAQVLLTDLPQYEGNIREKIRSFKDWESGEGFFDKLRETASDLGRELTNAKSGGTERATTPQQVPPVLSGEQQREDASPSQPQLDTVQPAEPLSFDRILSVVEPVLKPLGIVGLVMLFTVFILLQREDLRNRFIRLAGAGDLNRTTVAMTDAAKRLSRFFILQAVLNLSFGVIVALALWGLDVPAALGFGVFTALMRFVPYIGSILAALPPIAVAAAIEPGWSTALLVAAVFGIGEPLMGQVIEPVVFGRHTGLSPIAVVGAATFWTWLWGPIGLLLSMPLTLCLVVLGQHTRPLRFLTVLLSDEPALSPPEAFYQRLLAGDSAEVVWMSETALKQQSLVSYYDDVVLPGLRLAILDGRAGNLDDERMQDVAIALDDLVETLGDAELGGAHGDVVVGQAVATGEEGASAEARPAPWRERLAEASKEGLAQSWQQPGAVLIYPGRGALDFASARMAANLLGKLGIGVSVQARERAAQRPASQTPPELQLIASVGGLSIRELRIATRRVERARIGAQVIACAFAADRIEDVEGFAVVSTFAELLTVVLDRAYAAPRRDGEQSSQVALENAALT